MFKFPWTNEHELNLDWIVGKIKELNAKVLKIKIPEPYNGTPEPNSPYPGPGTSDKYARGDHSHPEIVMPQPYSLTPEPLGTPDPGSSYFYSRGNHVHPLPSLSTLHAASRWSVVWQNEDSTLEFAGQTLTIDVSNYDALLIVYRTVTATTRFITALAFLDGNYYDAFDIYNITQSSPHLIQRRVAIDPQTNEITFTNGYRKTLNTSSNGVSENTYLIPHIIYGATILEVI